MDYPVVGRGPAKKIVDPSEEMDNHMSGITNPNLHRQIVLKGSDDVADSETSVMISGFNSYRVIRHSLHDEDSDTSEIP